MNKIFGWTQFHSFYILIEVIKKNDGPSFNLIFSNVSVSLLWKKFSSSCFEINLKKNILFVIQHSKKVDEGKKGIWRTQEPENKSIKNFVLKAAKRLKKDLMSFNIKKTCNFMAGKIVKKNSESRLSYDSRTFFFFLCCCDTTKWEEKWKMMDDVKVVRSENDEWGKKMSLLWEKVSLW